MYSPDKYPSSVTEVPFCLWCYSTEKLSRCSRCGTAYYCSRDHQVQHWHIHKKECKNIKSCPPSTSAHSQVDNIDNLCLNNPCPTDNLVEEALNKTLNPDVDQIDFTGWINNNVLSQVESAESGAENTYVVDTPSTSEICYNDPQDLFVLPDNAAETSVPLYGGPESVTDALYAAVAAAEADGSLSDLSSSQNCDLFSSLSSELLSSTNNYWDVINDCNSENLSLNYDLDVSSFNKQDDRIIQSTLDDLNFTPEVINNKEQVEAAPEEAVSNAPLEEICLNIINDLNEYGICVIDNFLGSKMGNRISSEVKALFLKGIFKKGELACSDLRSPNENVRGDVITWVDGTEQNCRHIGNLIRKLDLVMTACNKMPDNGILSKYKLNRRTKAMIACYPGDGTHYKKHVDNPHGDGRCITCIYYLNKKWDTKTHGGLLRMFPVGHESEVANIEPSFDRMLFFWSDRRNPHEVLPSYAVRFAITVWYFDSDERDRALLKFRTHENSLD